MFDRITNRSTLPPLPRFEADHGSWILFFFDELGVFSFLSPPSRHLSPSFAESRPVFVSVQTFYTLSTFFIHSVSLSLSSPPFLKNSFFRSF